MNRLTADSIFLNALEQPTPQAVADYLTTACGGDAQLRERVDRLLAAHHLAATNFLEQPAAKEVLENGRGRQPSEGDDVTGAVSSLEPSVLLSLEQRLGISPSVTLRDRPMDRSPAANLRSSQLPAESDQGRYQLHGEIARGGMGAIIKGRDTDLGRDLAIKVLLDSHKQNAEYVARFVEEAQIGGQLQHPGIVPVYELGQFGDQRPFFTMKLVKGQTLAALLAKRKSAEDDVPKLLGIFEQICQTMAYAHSKGVIHRDLKPANIMVGAFGEVQVMDWGLAKVLRLGGTADEKKSLQKHRDATVIHTRRSTGSDEINHEVGSHTCHGSIMGTPAYMPPEQALGEVDLLDARADVFGLGAILTEILTGLPPYVADNATKVFRLASRGKLDDCLARLDGSGADTQLIETTKRAIAPEIDDRLADAEELSQRITGYLEGVQERLHQAEIERVEALARSQEERRRKRLYVAIGGLLLLIASGVALGGLVVANQQRAIAEKEEQNAKEQVKLRGVADRERQAADARAEDLSRSNYLNHLANADRAILSNDLALARMQLDACPLDQRGWEWTFLQRRIRATIPLALRGSEKPTFSDDGRRVASVGFYDYGSKDHHNAYVWDAKSGELLTSLRNDVDLAQVALLPDGESLAAVDVRMAVWDLKTGEKRWSTQLAVDEDGRAFYDGIAVSPDGAAIGTASWEGMIYALEAATGDIRVEIGPVEGGHFRSVSFSANSKWIATGPTAIGADRPCVIVNAVTGEIGKKFLGHAVPTFAPDGNVLATGSDNGEITLWNWDGKELAQVARWHTDQSIVESLAFSSDGRRLISGCADGEVSVWDVATGEMVARFDAGDTVLWLSAVPHSDRVAFFTIADGIRIWNDEQISERLVVPPPAADVRGTFVKFSPDGQRLATGTRGGDRPEELRILDAATGNRLVGRTDRSLGTWTNDGRHLASLGGDPAVVELMDTGTGRIEGVSTGEVAMHYARAVASTGKLVTAGDGKIYVWELDTGQEAVRMDGGVYPSDQHTAVSADGRYVAAGEHYGTIIRIYDLQLQKLAIRINAPGLWPSTMAFTEDSQQLYLGSNGGRLSVFDVASGDLIKQFLGHTQKVTAIALSPDESKLVAADSRGRVIIWDVANAQRLITLMDDEHPIAGVDWSSDGSRISVCKADGTVLVWNLP